MEGDLTAASLAALGPKLPNLRQGPRPLPFHLMAQLGALMASRTALPLWKNGSLLWKPHLATEAEAIRRDLHAVANEAFETALTAESMRRMDGFLRGIEAYRSHPYRRALPSVPTVWREGTTRLFDFSAPGASGPAVLVIPSLINRAYVLDLTERRSFVRYLAEKGLRPFLVDWDAPGTIEATFSLDDYIGGRLVRMLAEVERRAGPAFLAGYCMGGNLALALGLLRPDHARGLVLLATPWDFHKAGTNAVSQLENLAKPLDDIIAFNGVLPADILQILFVVNDPGGVERKFRRFGTLPRRSAAARNFVALEDWVNDCVPLAGPVARETLFDWYVGNVTAKGQWRVCGHVMQAERYDKPCLVMVPTKDRIVPAAGAVALAEALPKGRCVLVPTGHVSMMVGGRAKTDVYARVAKWLINHGKRQ
jgi:polyhydroxyalkanoate synthase